MLHEHQTHFQAMGTDISVIVADAPGRLHIQQKLAEVRALFAEQERRFSRFLPDSELSRMNADGGTVHPSDAMWEVLLRARYWWEATSGDFDPTILPALERAGYDRSFEKLSLSPSAQRARVEDRKMAGYGAVDLAPRGQGRAVTLNGGARVDLGGVVKGWTVDQAARLLDAFDAFLIDAGGDMRARGDSVDGDGWWIAVEDPLDPAADRAYVCLKDQAAATSGTYRRRWAGRDVQPAHHLIDRRSGLPSHSMVCSATVIGPDAETCDVLAKIAVLLGPERGSAFIEGWPGAQGMVVLEDGSERHTHAWPGIAGDGVILTGKVGA